MKKLYLNAKLDSKPPPSPKIAISDATTLPSAPQYLYQMLDESI